MARILVLTPQLPYPPHQGTTIRNYHLICGLARRHVIDVATFAGDRPGWQLANAPAALPGVRRLYTLQPPVRTLKQRAVATLTSPWPDMALRLESPGFHELLRQILACETYDVLQVEGIEMARYALSLPATLRPRLLFDDHNAEYVLQTRAAQTDLLHPRRWHAAVYSLIQSAKLRRYERQVCAAAHKVAVVSDADARALTRLGLPRPAVVPNGVDLEFFQAGAVEPAELAQPALVFTGKMDYRPNIDAVLWFVDAVLPLVRARDPRVHFYIVGQQPHVRLAPLRDNPNVTITGAVPDTRPYVAAAAAYVVPLRVGGGTRLKVLEALAMGAPVVSTRLGSDGFPFRDGIELSLADSAGDFAAAVLGLLNDRSAAQALGAQGRRAVAAQYGWSSILPAFEALYVA
jgi:polysaccharide biosynthesis protein PslH